MEERICKWDDQYLHNASGQRRTTVVVFITLLTMAAEIIFGLITGSMALLADGIHMGTHAFALTVTLIAYHIAKKHAADPDFAFSTGKVGILGGYTNAIILGITAVLMLYEAVERLLQPEQILFDQALIVAVLGLLVNGASALLLAGGQQHEHHGHQHQDHNLRAAYLHVITDALTSVLAIAALLIGKFSGELWPDAAVALLGAAVILKWSFGLLKSTGGLLVDHHPISEERRAVLDAAAQQQAEVEDLHIWQTSENSTAVIVHLKASRSFDRHAFESLVKEACGCTHLSLDIDHTDDGGE